MERDTRTSRDTYRERNLGSPRADYGRNAYGGRFADEGVHRIRGRAYDRGFLERAGDEVRSWLGDEEAERRRYVDEQMESRKSRGDGRRHRYGSGFSHETWTDSEVREVMTRDVMCAQPNDPVEYAARLMRDCDCGAIPVVDRDGYLIGMITDRDIAVRAVARGKDIFDARVGECMTDEAFACEETSGIDDCMREMSRHQVRRMPIVDRRGRVVGIVSQSDLARHAQSHRGTGERRAVADVLCAVSEPSAQPYR